MPTDMVVQQFPLRQRLIAFGRHQLTCGTARALLDRAEAPLQMSAIEMIAGLSAGQPGVGPRIGRSVSLDHAARLLGVSRRTIYNRIREGRLQTIRTIGGSQRVLLESVQDTR